MEGDAECTLSESHMCCYFNPLPPHGGRHIKSENSKYSSSFQSTPSAWRETEHIWTAVCRLVVFQSTPSAWRETNMQARCVREDAISIHSLRMEGDRIIRRSSRLLSYFNPLPPHGGRHGMQYHIPDAQPGFQSTPSAWRETVPKTVHAHLGDHFNPLPPHGGRPFLRAGICIPTPHISIHSLRMEGDGCTPGTPADASYFNPLPPHGGRRASGH